MLQTWIMTLMMLVQPSAPWVDTYEDTAGAIARVVDAEEPLFDGEDGRPRTAAILVSMAYYESAFNARAVGDGGRSFGLYQRWGGGPRMFDPTTATTAALKALRASMAACSARPVTERLAAYASGSCKRGGASSRTRMELANRLLFVSVLPGVRSSWQVPL